MKDLSFAVIVAVSFLAVSCGPTYFSLGVDMRNPTRSGIDLSGKNISVTYLDDGRDSVFMSSVAEGFTLALEKDYYNGEPHIGMYRIEKEETADYASRDSMVSLLMDTGVDVAFLFDLKSIGKPEDSVSEIPFEISLYVYDAMNQKDTVRIFKGDSSLKQAVDVGEQGLEVGRTSAHPFVSAWSNQRFVFYYYDTGGVWNLAAEYVSEYRFKEAVDIWMSLLDTGNMRKRAYAEYNIAAVCCITGEKGLAAEWLDRADADYPVPYSYSLRTKISSLP